jgi:hypothetical protein
MKRSNPGSHPQKSLNECNPINPLQEPRNEDKVPRKCDADLNEQVEKSQKYVPGEEESWRVETASNEKVGIGQEGNCDPMQSGQIINDLKNPDKRHLFRYSKSLRGTDEAVTDLFKNIVVLDDDGGVHPIPIKWASQERAVAWIMEENLRRDNSLVVDRIRLPALAIHSNNITFNQDRYLYHKAVNWLREGGKPGFTVSEKAKRDTVFGVAKGLPVDVSYTLYAWALYIEDMNQIVEQIISKFSPIAYINVRGVTWESIVKLDSMANNLEVEPGDASLRVVKFQFNLTAETYIPQPIRREKSVLKIKTDFFNKTNEEEITDVLTRIEDAVEEIEDDFNH